ADCGANGTFTFGAIGGIARLGKSIQKRPCLAPDKSERERQPSATCARFPVLRCRSDRPWTRRPVLPVRCRLFSGLGEELLPTARYVDFWPACRQSIDPRRFIV